MPNIQSLYAAIRRGRLYALNIEQTIPKSVVQYCTQPEPGKRTEIYLAVIDVSSYSAIPRPQRTKSLNRGESLVGLPIAIETCSERLTRP